MAFVRKRGKKFSVVYKVKDENGIFHQKSETYDTQTEANSERRKLSIKWP